MRERPIPWAYRVFFRQIGLDPDRTRTPVEQLALERLREGAFKSRGLPIDALTIATIETGVALRVFDAEQVRRRASASATRRPGESLAGQPGRAAARERWSIADERAPVGLLFGATAEGQRGGRRQTGGSRSPRSRSTACPQIAVDEALWMAAATLERPRQALRPLTKSPHRRFVR